MYYHIPYAYHLHEQGLLEKTVSCRDTRCFYWFSPDHEERYDRRDWVTELPSIGQTAWQLPDYARWQVPDFRARWSQRYDFGFTKPLLLIFNKYNIEWSKPPINFFSREFLLTITDQLTKKFQVVYFRPTSKIVMDHSELLDLHEKEALVERDVLVAETLHDRCPELTFNEFQLCLLAQSNWRVAVQGGATYMNSLFPGELFVLHRHGRETRSNTYEHLHRMNVDKIRVFDEENELGKSLLLALLEDDQWAGAAAA
jgi:hypothetical protein